MTVNEHFDWIDLINYPTGVTALEFEKMSIVPLKEYLDWVYDESNKSDNLGEL